MEPSYYRACCDRLSDILQDFICDGDDGVEQATNAIRETIDSWLEYHEGEAAKWKKLKSALHL